MAYSRKRGRRREGGKKDVEFSFIFIYMTIITTCQLFVLTMHKKPPLTYVFDQPGKRSKLKTEVKKKKKRKKKPSFSKKDEKEDKLLSLLC